MVYPHSVTCRHISPPTYLLLSDNVTNSQITFRSARIKLVSSTSLRHWYTCKANIANIARRKDILITFIALMSATCTITLLVHPNPLIHHSNASTCISAHCFFHMTFYSAFLRIYSDLRIFGGLPIFAVKIESHFSVRRRRRCEGTFCTAKPISL